MPKFDLRPADAPEKSYQPEHWSPRHRMAVQLSALGFRNKEIAEKLDYTEQTVSKILTDPRAHADLQTFVRNVASSTQDVRLRLDLLSNEALDKVVELLNSNDERVAQKSAFDILDRAGYGAVKKVQNVGADIDEEIARRLSLALSESDAVEAEYEMVEDAGAA